MDDQSCDRQGRGEPSISSSRKGPTSRIIRSGRLRGKELFYDPRSGGFEGVGVTTQPTFAFGNPVAVPKPFQSGAQTQRRAYDMTPGGRFVGLVTAGQTESGGSAPPQIQVVLNWFEELKARAPIQR
jgi:hypothetical protein